MSDLPPTKRFNPNTALLAVSIVLPAFFFAVASWESYRVALRESTTRVERTARILQEHAIKVFETHKLVIDLVNARLRFMDWSSEGDRADLHALLAKQQNDLDQVATVTVTDAEGRLEASSRSYPVDSRINLADRDWFVALRASDLKAPFVSRSYVGRQSGQTVFNVAARAAGRTPGTFNGVVAVSVDRGYFENFYKGVEPTFEYAVALIRDDGTFLARQPPTELNAIDPRSVLLKLARNPTENVSLVRSSVDGIMRLSAVRRVGDEPVFVGFAITLDSALKPWRTDLLAYGIVALFTAAVLLAVSTLAIRRAAREHSATMRWQDTATQLQAEVTQRERAEEQLRQSQKMEAVGQLTGGVAHDFNNLLTVIRSSIDLLKRPNLAEDRRQRYIEAISDTTTRATRLTSQLLAFARRQALKPEVFDVAESMKATREVIATLTGSRIKIVTRVPDQACPVNADANQFDTSLVNLAVNARDAMSGEGTLTIVVDTVTRIPELRGRPAVVGAFVAVSVSDTGSGIAPEDLERIFEPFFTTKGVGHGTGLGLSQVFGFAKQSGGDVAVASEPGRGSTFTLYLPRVAAHKRATTPGVSQHTIDGHGTCVLLVEDNVDVGSFATLALDELGYRSVLAVDAEAALAELVKDAARFDVVFSDVVMPGMNGIELAQRIRGRYADLPVVLTSGYSHVLAESGTHGFELLQKPYSIEQLSHVLAKAAHARRLTRVLEQ